MVTCVRKIMPHMRNVNKNRLHRPRRRISKPSQEPHRKSLHTFSPVFIIDDANLLKMFIFCPRPDWQFIFFHMDIRKSCAFYRAAHSVHSAERSAGLFSCQRESWTPGTQDAIVRKAFIVAFNKSAHFELFDPASWLYMAEVY